MPQLVIMKHEQLKARFKDVIFEILAEVEKYQDGCPLTDEDTCEGCLIHDIINPIFNYTTLGKTQYACELFYDPDE